MLKDNRIVPASLEEYMKWCLKNSHFPKIIKQEVLEDGAWISTIFLGMDLSSSKGKPILFETVLFTSESLSDSFVTKRFRTLKQTLEGHEEIKKKHLEYPNVDINKSFEDELKADKGKTKQ